MFGNLRWTKQYGPCNLCEQDDCEVLFCHDQHSLGLRTVICRKCGLIYLNPRPAPQDYDNFYRNWYHRLYPARAAFHGGRLGAKITAETARRRCATYSAFLTASPHLLEIGPGEGAFLEAVREALPEARVGGIDRSPAEADRCRCRGLKVSCGTIEEAPLSDKPYTHVAAFHVLEHALDPLGMLRAIASCMEPGGHLFLEVPNIFGSWRGLGMLHVAHPYQFSSATLTGILQAAGFAILQIDELEDPLFPSSLRIIARSEENFVPAAGFIAPDLPQVHALFAEKLRHWRREAIAAWCMRTALSLISPRWTVRLWEITRGRKWERALAGADGSPSARPGKPQSYSGEISCESQ
jgi:2-polyprenyl-3-methyl-5-hydroxy-6-metoxy-1,4-benzoquinol methylase